MFLVVFVTLVISIIGLFTQVIAVQSARIYNAQTGLAQVMELWHGVALTLAMSGPAGGAGATLSGCRMTAAAAGVTALPACVSSQNGQQMLIGASTAAPLPGGYNSNAFSFMSVAYQTVRAPVNRYVVTYITANSNGHLQLPSAKGAFVEIGYSQQDLMRQLTQTAGLSIYGTVSATGVLSVAPSSTVPNSSAYDIPPTIPVGAIALLSAAN